MGRRVTEPRKPRAPRFEGFKPSSERASATARAIGRKDTKAEVALRKALWALGVRYRKHYARLPGRPDIVIVAARIAIFVDGDFWHGRDWEARRAKLRRGANAPYWLAKIEANMRRDREKTELLVQRGWTVLRLWERDVRADPEAAARSIATLCAIISRDSATVTRHDRE